MSDWFKGSPGESQAGALFGNLSLGAAGYGSMIGLVVLIAAVTAGTSRLTVHRTLQGDGMTASTESPCGAIGPMIAAG